MLTPGSQDLELAARAVRVLVARGHPRFSTPEFTAVARARATDRIGELLAFLERCDLLESSGGGWELTDGGKVTFKRLAVGDWAPYAHALLASGAYEAEIVRVIETAVEAEGELRCPLAVLPRLAPRAGVLLRWDPGLREGDELILPQGLLDSLLASAAAERAAEVPAWVLDRNSIGWRAELYSLRLQRSSYGAKRVLHVSADVGDRFGYDIETRADLGPRLIEVKGSRSAQVSFVITRKELAVARERPEGYEIQFWGGIDLSRPAGDEYRVLRELGYPIVISDCAAAIETEGWAMEPQSWRVTKKA